MHVGVNEAGQQCDVAQIDDFGPLRMLDRAAHGADALALDEYLAGLKQRSGIHLEQPRRVEHDGRAGRLLGVDCAGKDEGQSEDEQTRCAGAKREILHDTRICRSGPLLSRAEAAKG